MNAQDYSSKNIKKYERKVPYGFPFLLYKDVNGDYLLFWHAAAPEWILDAINGSDDAVYYRCSTRKEVNAFLKKELHSDSFRKYLLEIWPDNTEALPFPGETHTNWSKRYTELCLPYDESLRKLKEWDRAVKVRAKKKAESEVTKIELTEEQVRLVAGLLYNDVFALKGNKSHSELESASREHFEILSKLRLDETPYQKNFENFIFPEKQA